MKKPLEILAPAGSTQALEAALTDKYEMCDVSLYRGGQPLYYYLIAVE